MKTTTQHDCLSIPENIGLGIELMRLLTRDLYDNDDGHRRFESRLNEFLSVCDCPDVFGYDVGVLTYQTESVIPAKKDSRPPLLLLFGNPAPESVMNKCFFARKKGKVAHRFWPVMKSAQIVDFEGLTGDIHVSRTKALFDLDYTSDFRIGLAVFYSLPSPASRPKWSGVAGLRTLFGTRAMRQIAEYEKKRVEGVIGTFIGDNRKGAVVAFQKDAYLGIRDVERQEVVVSRDGRWLVAESRCSSNGARLFKMPPTRYLMAPWYPKLMSQVRRSCTDIR